MPQPNAPLSRFAREVSWVFGGQASILLVGLVTGALTARLLGPEGRGVLGLITSLAGIVALGANLGLPTAFTWFAGSGDHSPTALARASWRLLALTAALGLGVYTVVVVALRERVVGSATDVAVVCGGLLIVEALSLKQFQALLRGLRRIADMAAVGVLRQVARLVLTAVLVGALGYGVTGAVLAALGGGLVAVGFSLVRVHGAARGAHSDSDRPVRLLPLLRFGAVEWLLQLCWMANLRVDAFLVLRFRGEAAVGHYSQAAGLAEQLWLVSTAVSAVLLPTLLSQAGQDRAKTTADTSRATLVLLAAVVGPGLLLAGPFVRLLYGAEFEPSVAPFRILLVAAVLLAVRSLVADYFRAQKMLVVNLASTAVASVVNVVANLYAIPRWGIAGSAAASLFSYGLDCALALLAFRLATGISPARLLVPSRADYARAFSVGRRLFGKVLGRAA